VTNAFYAEAQANLERAEASIQAAKILLETGYTALISVCGNI